ncbi:A disintegrin and metalloproteinase with thrombospondin motifs adt-2-like isoform X2 [Ruditapes philippinarum]|uniref:A disintegrin and metalloproteinase with thrombospondin motifs adt-2-like isoform X2 n=1 Tax=Ruditapes philippinarum TaxID=129788 RepID=UPI00295C3063|nr:A disintegrin and metalloproteinase with thrombospondin motifs adt-2-like isoform X2 [Ruditapes philippinarum]
MGCTDNQNCGDIPEYDAVTKLNALPVEKCYECCDRKGCNYHLCKHPKPSQCKDDKRVDCAKMNEMFDICKDIHDAKLVCPNFCNLCRLVDGSWADWSQWSACDVTCGNGNHTRTRTCTNPAPSYQGLECEGKNMDFKPCQRPLCPVHGGWSSWSDWSACPVTCGLGQQKRHRNCSSPYPLRYDGIWGNWKEWGSCSTSCDSGIRQRSRSCVNLVGTICNGNSLEVQLCNRQDCPCNTMPTLRNGVLKRQSESPSKITFNIVCNDGYQVAGQNHTTCDKKSGWSKLPICKLTCGEPAVPSNGRLVFTSGIVFESIAKFECLSGFISFGNPVSTCEGNGKWSTSLSCASVVKTCSARLTYNASYTNVALRKTVELSSTYSAACIGAKMVDGYFNNVAITQKQYRPFAIVDLEDIYSIFSIYIVNRKDCCATGLKNVVIQIGVEANKLVTVARHQTAIGAECTLRFENPLRGRYVKIMLEITEYLQITEFQVFSQTRT